MRITVVGTGYVGLVAGAGFADFGNRVTCVDTDAAKIAKLKAGEIPIYEPGLEALVRRNQLENRLLFTADIHDAVVETDVVFVAVGTPQSDDGTADLSFVMNVAEQLAAALSRDSIVVLKSTVPVGTNDRVQKYLDEHARCRHRVVSNPEFLKEGDAVNDFLHPDRVIVGARDDVARNAMHKLYAPLQLTHERLMFMPPRSAELTKYVANAMLATRISFMNEVARLCEAVGADVTHVRKGIGADGRIGPKFLFPGPGFGGSCFPKDIQALMRLADENGSPLAIVSAVHEVNARQKNVLFEKLGKLLGRIDGARVAVWGLAFKPKTDDVRESPALSLIARLVDAGAEVRAHDPAAMATARVALGSRASKVILVDHPYDATSGADALVLATEWQEYRSPDFELLGTRLRRKILVDGRNVWRALEPEALGFTYEGIGVRSSPT